MKSTRRQFNQGATGLIAALFMPFTYAKRALAAGALPTSEEKHAQHLLAKFCGQFEGRDYANNSLNPSVKS